MANSWLYKTKKYCGYTIETLYADGKFRNAKVLELDLQSSESTADIKRKILKFIKDHKKQLQNEIQYLKKEMRVCACSKRDLYELSALEEELEELEETLEEVE